jgi:hypothetical protein
MQAKEALNGTTRSTTCLKTGGSIGLIAKDLSLTDSRRSVIIGENGRSKTPDRI